MLTCAECGQNVDDLSDHLLRNHPSCRVFTCGQGNCKGTFVHKTSLMRHIKTLHQTSMEVSLPSSSLSPSLAIGANSATSSTHDFEENMDIDDPGSPGMSAEDFLLSQAEHMVMELRAAKLTGEAVAKVMDLTTTLLQSYLTSVKEQVKPMLEDNGVPPEKVSEILAAVKVPNIFKNLKDIESQLQHFKKKYGLAVPEDKYLGYRIDKRLDPSTNLFVQCQVLESFQYIPIIDSLKMILSQESIRKKVMSAKPSEDGVLRSHLDGEIEFMQPVSSNEIVVHIILYHDDLEVANALGSKTSIHKLGAFLFQILDLPNEDLGELSSIHLVALAYAEDLKKDDAFKTALSPFVRDMKKLAVGVPVVYDGVSYTLKSQVIDFSADSLAAHAALGLLSCSAKYFCRMCLITREELRSNANAVGAPRTLELHQQHVEQVKMQRKFSTQCGVQRENALSELPYFDFTKQSVFDIFHDILEGVAAMDMKLVLREIILVRELISVYTFNENVASFSYGLPDDKNKPSANFTEKMLQNVSTSGKLKQSGSQTWCLLRAFPFLIGEALPDAEQDRHMQLIFLMQDIAQILFSYSIKPAHIDDLENLIERHHDLFKELFVDPAQEDEVESDGENEAETQCEGDSDIDDPDIVEETEAADDQEVTEPEGESGPPLKKRKVLKKVHNFNKMHHVKHYGKLIRLLGPIVRFYCAKFEGRLKIFRQFASICNCFKNIPKTMARMFQLSTLGSMLGESGVRLLHQKGRDVNVSETPVCEALLAAGLSTNDTLLSTNSASMNGVEYRPGLFVCISNKPEFAMIENVYVYKNIRLFLVVKKWKSEGKIIKFNSYHVTPTDEFSSYAMESTNLAHVRPLAPWAARGSTHVYLALKTIIV